MAKAELERGAALDVSALAASDTAFLVNYAIGQVMCVSLASRCTPHIALVLGLVASVVCCALVPVALHQSPALFLVLWGLHGFLQSGLHPTIIRLLGPLMDGSPNKGFYMGVWSTSQSVGGIFGSLLGGWVISSGLGWEAVFQVPGAPTLMVAGILFVQTLVRRGADRRTATVKDTNSKAQARKNSEDPVVAKRAPLGLLSLLRTPGALRLAVSFFIVKLLRYAMLLWLPYYHTKMLGHADALAASLATAFEVGGALGALLLGYVSDQLATQLGGPGRARLHLCAAGLLISSLLFVAYPSTAKASASGGYLLMVLVGITVEGPESAMSSSMLADISDTSDLTDTELGRLAGLVNGVGIAGAACTGFVQLLTSYGDEEMGFFLFLTVAAAVAGAALEVRMPALWSKQVYSELDSIEPRVVRTE